jgi:hypothetical protein
VAAATDLHDFAVELLALSEAALDTLIVSGLEGAPARSFVSPGRPPMDCCDQLTVNIEALQDGDTSPGGIAAGRTRREAKLNNVRALVTITRCVQGLVEMPDLPDPADLQATAAQTDADAWALWNELYDDWRSGLLLTICTEVFFEGMRAIAQQGGCVGWELSLRVVLDGYDTAASS